jgi:hypothetical protein
MNQGIRVQTYWQVAPSETVPGHGVWLPGAGGANVAARRVGLRECVRSCHLMLAA